MIPYFFFGFFDGGELPPSLPNISAGSLFPRKKHLPTFWTSSTEWQSPDIYYAKRAKQEDEFFMLTMQ